MNDREFDKIIVKGLKDPQFSSPQWERMEKALDEAMAPEEYSFDNFIMTSMSTLAPEGTPSWDKMSGILDQNNVASIQDDLLEEDKIIAEKLRNLSPASSNKWSSFSRRLEEELPLTKERDLLDSFFKRALLGLVVTENPNWSRMNFILDSDHLLGDHQAFDHQIKDAVDASVPQGNMAAGWNRLQSALDLELARRRSIYRSKALEAAIILLLLFALPGLLFVGQDKSTPMPVKDEAPAPTESSEILSQSEQNVPGLTELTSELSSVKEEQVEMPRNSQSFNASVASDQQAEVVYSESAIANADDLPEMKTLSGDDSNNIEFLNTLETPSESYLMVSDMNEEDNIDKQEIASLQSLNAFVSDNHSLEFDLLPYPDGPSSDKANEGKLKIWIPYVGAQYGVNWLEMQLRNPDSELINQDKPIVAQDYGVKGGISNGVLDLSTGLSRMMIDYSNVDNPASFLDHNDSTFRVAIDRKELRAIQVPLNLGIRLPIEDTKLDLMVNVGVRGSLIQEMSYGFDVDYVIPDPDLPEGGRYIPVPDVSLDFQDKLETSIGKESSFLLDGTVGLGLSYELGKNLSITVEGSNNIPLGKRRIGKMGDKYESAYRLGMGIQYRFP